MRTFVNLHMEQTFGWNRCGRFRIPCKNQ